MKPQLRLVFSQQQHRNRQTILEARKIKKTYSVKSTDIIVLDDVGFSADKGEMICVLGRSGCGKTTLLNILAGFILPTSGDVLLENKQINGPGSDRGVVFQQDALFPWLTVEENIAFGMRGRKHEIRKKTERFLDFVGLRDFRTYLPRELSGGMKQRVALARVLIREPKVLLMDEPFAALDAQTRREMQNLLLSLWETLNYTIVFITHDVHEAVTLADRILFMDKNPGHIREDIRVDLPRPRDTETDQFLDICKRLYEALRL